MNNSSYVHLYVEKFDRYEKFVLLDFVSFDEFTIFMDRIDNPKYNRENPTSMLLLEHVLLKEGINPKEGEVYKVSLKHLLEMKWVNYDYLEGSSDSNAIAFRLDGNVSQSLQDVSQIFQDKALRNQFMYHIESRWNETPFGGGTQIQDIECIVKNVGQGSWNEIRSSGKCKLIFDFGASIFFSKSKCISLLGDKFFEDNPTIIISHWDIDHYNLLTIIDDSDLKKISSIYVPDECISLTSKVIAKRLEEHCKHLCSIKPESKKMTKCSISMHVKYESNQYILMNGENSRNKNLSGLSLIVRNKNSIIFFCADHSYKQIFYDMFNAVHQSANKLTVIYGRRPKLHLIVPHHGGNAGKIKYTNFPKPGQAIVSVGNNNYGHPLEYARKELCKAGFKWIRTDFVNSDVFVG